MRVRSLSSELGQFGTRGAYTSGMKRTTSYLTLTRGGETIYAAARLSLLLQLKREGWRVVRG